MTKTSTRSARGFALAASVLMLANCGGHSGGDSSSTGITLQQRTNAATTTVSSNAACATITPFYWEIGDANGLIASGTGGDNSTSPPNPANVMPVASASKWLFSTYVVEQQSGVLSASDIPYLNFQSGYVNLNACSTTSSVASCLTETGTLGGTTTNGTQIPATVGHFFYNGGHMEVLANNIGLGTDTDAPLATAIEAVLGTDVPLVYFDPQLAGGAGLKPSDYAKFLRNLLGGSRYPHMLSLLGTNAVCTHSNSTDCPSALFSPVNQSAPGPTNDVGDGAFSSPGRFGFYPWIDKSKTYYGILARYDTANVSNPDPTKASYITSVYCGRLIRKAWELGRPQ